MNLSDRIGALEKARPRKVVSLSHLTDAELVDRIRKLIAKMEKREHLDDYRTQQLAFFRSELPILEAKLKAPVLTPASE